MWSMGLVLFYLFVNREYSPKILLPPFIYQRIAPPRLYDGFDISSFTPHPKDIKILKELSQEEIDSTLVKFKMISLINTPRDISTEVLKWWNLIEKMIRKQPEKRISSEDAVKTIS